MELDELVVNTNILYQAIGDIKYSPNVDTAYSLIGIAYKYLTQLASLQGYEYVEVEEDEFKGDNKTKIRFTLHAINELLNKDLTGYYQLKTSLQLAGELLFKELDVYGRV